jgi:uncharacterized membrane protein (DUF106 family)
MYAVRWAKTAIIYMVLGVTLGIYMSIAEKFDFRPVHAHLNLVGWASMGIFAALYKAFPELENSRMAPYHFWIYQIGSAGMLSSLFSLVANIEISGKNIGEMTIPITSNLAFLGVIVSAVLICFTLKNPRKDAKSKVA